MLYTKYTLNNFPTLAAKLQENQHISMIPASTLNGTDNCCMQLTRLQVDTSRADMQQASADHTMEAQRAKLTSS